MDLLEFDNFEEYEEHNRREQKRLEVLYGAEDKSDIYHKDEKCVYNKESKAFKECLEIHEKDKDWEYYPGLKDLQMSTCYDCNRCGIWGEK